MKLAPIIISAISVTLLCSCAKTDQAMYKAYIDATKSNNSVEREKLSQQGKTARAAIFSQQGITVTTGNHSQKQSNILIQKALMQKAVLQNAEKYDNQWRMVPVNSGPPCSIVCADGCTDECKIKCPDLCDDLEEISDYVEKEKNERKDQNEENSAYTEPEHKTQQEMPAINVIGSTNVTINLGAGATTTSEKNKEKNRQVKLPKSIGHIATEKAFSIGNSLLKWGSIFGIVDSVSDGISRISESPNYYIDNQGRNEVFDSRDQSTSGSFNGE